jgi:hypothetical protein
LSFSRVLLMLLGAIFGSHRPVHNGKPPLDLRIRSRRTHLVIKNGPVDCHADHRSQPPC